MEAVGIDTAIASVMAASVMAASLIRAKDRMISSLIDFFTVADVVQSSCVFPTP
jgi:hypothetical protein